MGDYKETTRKITQAFIKLWDPTKIPLVLENEGSDPPQTSWAQLSIRYRGGRQVAIAEVGERRFERFGSMNVQVFTPIGNRTEEGLDLCQIVVDHFEGNRLAGTSITFEDTFVTQVGPDPEDAWFQTNLEVYFTFYLLK